MRFICCSFDKQKNFNSEIGCLYNERVQDFKYYRPGVTQSLIRAFGNAYLALHLTSGHQYVIKKI